MMKHAYLILAHNEFEVLRYLIESLDDVRNDIFIHVDKKVKDFPKATTKYARVFYLEERVDIRWGNYSQIKAELLIFEYAYKLGMNLYSRYHLLSGTHLPLKSQNFIHEYFEKFENIEVLNQIYTDNYEINLKINSYNFFTKYFRDSNKNISKLAQFSWKVLIRLQRIFKICRRSDYVVRFKAQNWVSLSSKGVDSLIKSKLEIADVFKFSFCGDEFLVPYLINIDNSLAYYNSIELVYTEFEGASPRILKEVDYNFLKSCDFLFARKFSSSDLSIVKKIVRGNNV